MAGRPYAPFIGPSEPVADRKASSQRAINLYVAGVDGSGEDKSAVLESAPGITALVTMPGVVRGMIAARDSWYVVAEDKLYSLTSAGVYTELGTLDSNAGAVSMKESRDQLVIVDGDFGYVMNLATLVFGRITDSDFRGSHWVEELDGYSIFVAPDTDQFYLAQIDDASTLDSLDFSSADASPDNIVTHRVVRKELMLFGSRSIETWVNSGDPDFPFTRYNSTPIDVGCVGVRAVCNAADTVYWVGQTGRGAAYVYELQGHQPIRMSTQAVEESLATSTDISGCWIWTYQAEGSEFICISAPGMDTTWCFDAATRKWHERCELDNGDYIACRVEHAAYFNGVHYVSADEKIYTMSRSIYTIDGAELPRERTWPHLIKPSMEPVAYRGVELACTTGYNGTEGFITLEISNDGGSVYGSPLIKSLGVVGQRMRRIRWLMLGASRDRVFRVRVTSAVPVTFHGCTIDA